MSPTGGYLMSTFSHVVRLIKRLFWGCVAFALTANPAVAQVLEEVVVTAQKREQNVQDVGISITAFTGEQLDKLNWDDSTQIATMTAGVHLSSQSSGQTRQFTIRGVTQNGFDEHVELPNAVYMDEGYLATPQAALFTMFDLERVEILKGPQGTLFGRNATGGLVHYITRKPGDELEGYLDVSYGRFDKARVEGAINLPVSDDVAIRVSGTFQRWDPIYDNKYDPSLPTALGGAPTVGIFNPITGTSTPTTLLGSPSGAADPYDDKQYAVRAHLLWEPQEGLELLVTGFSAEQGDISSGPYQSGATTAVVDAAGGHVNTIFSKDDPNNCQVIRDTGGCDPAGVFFGLDGDVAVTRPVPGGDLFGFIEPDGDGKDVWTDHVANINNYKSWGGKGMLTYDMANDMTMTAVLHYVGYEKYQTLDVDGAPAPQSIVMNASETDSFTAEVRFNGEFERARWVAGFYYLFLDTDYEIGLAFSPFSPVTLSPVIGNGLPLETDNRAQLETNSYSLFGQLDIDLTDQLTFIAGLRAIREEKDFVYSQGFFVNNDDAVKEGFQEGFTPLPFGIAGVDPGGLAYAPFDAKTSDTLWAGKLLFEYKPNDDWLLFAGVNRGVKAGSFNAKLNDFTPPLDPREIPYSEEVLTAYEVGFKATLFSGTTRLNGSFFFYDYDDYQSFVFVQSSGSIGSNDAKFKGVEFEIQTSPLDGLDFLFNAAFLDADVTNFETAPGHFRDVTPSFTPQAQLAGMIRYEWADTALFGGSFAVQADAYYASSNYHNLRNYEAQQMAARRVGNVKATWYSADEKWEVQGFVDNVADEVYKITGFDLPTLCGCNEEAYGLPRWWGVRVRYNWDGGSLF